jgi:Tfp pilus assembly protein PilX
MTTLPHANMQRNYQRGAALAVGLMLLVVITLLAISGMNTSILELQMAGNSQFRQNAFQNAETGLQVTRIDPLMKAIDKTTSVPAATVSGVSSETYTVTVHQSCDQGMHGPPPDGYSWDKDQRTIYDITSTGESSRGARVVLTEGIFDVTPRAC